MYTDESVAEVKEAAKVADVIGDYVTLKKKGPNLVGLCPFHDEKTPSFTVTESENFYKCFGCSKGGGPVQFVMDYRQLRYTEALEFLAVKYNISLIRVEDRVYIKPTWKNNTTLMPNVVKWFEKRKISQKTIQQLKITDGPEWMPNAAAEVHTVQFNYFRKSELINVKYRDKAKGFKLHKGSELIVYNLDSVIGKKEVYWVEGEIDCASLVEAGYVNETCGVISVPNGASLPGKDGLSSNNLTYINNCIEQLSRIEKHHIALDDDIPGRMLREDIALRFGKDKCDYISWGGKKDANEVLMTEGDIGGIQGIINCCSKPQNFPVEGTFTISDISNKIDDLYFNGLDKGVNLHIPEFELNIVLGYFTIITGIPSHGKTTFLDYIVLNLMRFSRWTGAFYAPESMPMELHFSEMASMLIGKPWEGDGRMSIEEVRLTKNYLDKKLWFIEPEEDFTLASILASVKALIRSYGIKFFVIDAWNKLEHKEKDTDYVSRALDIIATFCKLNKVHCFLIAHPTKIDKEFGKDKYKVPTLYNISGSAHFYNKCFNGISVYRDFDTGETFIYRQKVKYKHWGRVGYSKYKFSLTSSRYYPEGFPDFKNWITGETNLTQAKEEGVSQQMDVFYDTSNTDEPPF